MNVEITDEHRWLARLVGSWDVRYPPSATGGARRRTPVGRGRLLLTGLRIAAERHHHDSRSVRRGCGPDRADRAAARLGISFPLMLVMASVNDQ